MATGDVVSPNDPPTVPVDLGPIGPKQRYEFTPDQEAVIADLAGKMQFVGMCMFGLAVLWLFQVIFVAVKVEGHPFDVFTAITALIYGLIGYWTMSASGDFAAVVATVGWDVPHVMDALRSLRKMYSLLFYLLVAAIIASLILMVSYRVR
jgi:hypothetical protein